MQRITFLLSLLAISIWLAVFTTDNQLHIIACDVGQGDAVLIQKQNTQILIDGGPSNKVLDCLGKHMPFYDKDIEFVILTHPQEDHYGGLIDVVKNYNVLQLGHNAQEPSNMSYEVLRKEMGGRGVDTITLHKGQTIRVGMIYLDVLNPLDNSLTADSNNQGIVTLLRYGQFKALFTADVEQGASDKLSEYPEIEKIDYIKVNHHGSKNGLSQKLLDVTNPNTAVISVGKNSYGHPHEEVIKKLSDKGIKILRTDLLGDIDYEVEN